MMVVCACSSLPPVSKGWSTRSAMSSALSAPCLASTLPCLYYCVALYLSCDVGQRGLGTATQHMDTHCNTRTHLLPLSRPNLRRPCVCDRSHRTFTWTQYDVMQPTDTLRQRQPCRTRRDSWPIHPLPMPRLSCPHRAAVHTLRAQHTPRPHTHKHSRLTSPRSRRTTSLPRFPPSTRRVCMLISVLHHV